MSDAAELDWGYILEFWDPNQHFGERMTADLDQTLHAIHCKRVTNKKSQPRIIRFFGEVDLNS